MSWVPALSLPSPMTRSHTASRSKGSSSQTCLPDYSELKLGMLLPEALLPLGP